MAQPPRRTRRAPQASELNVCHALREHEELHEGEMLAFDTFSGRILLMKPLPGGRESKLPRPWHDTDTTQLMLYFQGLNWSKVSFASIRRAVLLEAFRNQFSVVVDYLDALPAWDGELRVRRFLHDVAGVSRGEEGMTDQEVLDHYNYVQEVSHILFMSIVARAYKPGCKVDTMVVWEGRQGTEKSRLLRKLALNEEWFSDSMPRDVGTKDAKLHLRGKLVIEMAENAAIKGSRAEDIKNFLTVQTDNYRPPYAEHPIDVPRGCSFIGTTNESNYLDDATGNRRYLPVRVGKINMAKAEMWIEQCFAEAIQMWKTDPNVEWWMPLALLPIAEAEQRSRLGEDAWELSTIAFLHSQIGMKTDHFYVTISKAISEGVGLEVTKIEPRHMMRMGTILAKLGGVKVRKREGKMRPWEHKFNVDEVRKLWEAADRPPPPSRTFRPQGGQGGPG